MNWTTVEDARSTRREKGAGGKGYSLTPNKKEGGQAAALFVKPLWNDAASCF